MIPRNQLSIADIFSDCREILDLDKPRFLDFLENHIHLDKIAPASFESISMHLSRTQSSHVSQLIIRRNEEWNQTHRICGNMERVIHHCKDNCCLDGCRSRNPKTLRVDLLLCGITQLLTLLLADSIRRHQHIRSLKNLIA